MNLMFRNIMFALVFLFGSYIQETYAYVTDQNVYPATNYYSFQPPLPGGSYADPAFGTTISRISDAANTIRADTGGLLPWVEDEYSTKSPFNADNSKILLEEFSYFALYDGTTLKRIKPYLSVSASSEPLWSRSDPNTFYFHPNGSNQLKTYNVATDVQTDIHTFSEYASITGQGESEMSYDGDHVVLTGDGHDVFVYTISTNTKGPVFDTSGKGTLDAVYISPNNNVLIAWPTSGTSRYHGEELYDINMIFLRQVANNDGHKHMTRDTDGSEVLIQTNSADPTPLANCTNGIVKIKLATATQTCILPALDWSLAVHVSAPDQNGWAFVETYNVSSAASPWFAYTNELLQVKLDGTETRRLAQHRSNSTAYDGQPHISVSRDGSRFTFNSNMMGSTTDVYMALVPGVVSGPSITTVSLPSGVQNVAYSAALAATAGTTPYTWSLTSGTLPAGLTLASSTGIISGTPMGTGIAGFTVQVKDANSMTAPQLLSMAVKAPAAVSITPASLPAGTQNTAYTATLTATGGIAPYTWSISSGSLPAGLTLVSNTVNTAAISGTPIGAGTSNFTVQVLAPGASAGSQALSIAVNSSGGTTGGSSMISTVQSNAGRSSNIWSVAVPFKSSNTVGNLIVAFVRMATVSQGVTVTDTARNVYKDAVFQVQSADNHQIHIFYAKNISGGANSVTAEITKRSNGIWMAIYEFSGASTTNPLDQTAHAQGNTNSPFAGLMTTANANEMEFVATGLPDSYTGSVAAGNGFAMLLQNGGASAGDNEGAITAAPGQYGGKFNLSSITNWSSVAVTFVPALSVSPSSPSITTTSLPGGTQNTAYSTTVTASNGTAPYIWTIVQGSGSLPAGLTLGPSTANTVVISGTPTSPGASNFTVQVTDSKSLIAAKALSLTIIPGNTSTVTRLEQDNAAVSYAGPWAGVWSTVSNGAFSGGTAAEAMDNGSTATLNFVGTGVSWIGYKDPWSGIAQVYLDGALAGQIDTYSASAIPQAVPYAISGLASGNHQLVIKVIGQKNSSSGGSWVWIDAFNVQP